MIFFALALSWVKELTEVVKPNAQRLFLSFNKEKNENGKLISAVQIKGFPGKDLVNIPLTPVLYDLLYTFAEKRKTSCFI